MWPKQLVRVYFIGSGTGLTGVTCPSPPTWSTGIRILLRSRWKFFAVLLPFPATPMLASRKPEIVR